MNSSVSKRKRLPDDDGSVLKTQLSIKRQRREQPVPGYENNDTQSTIPGEPPSGQEDSDDQTAAMMELALLRDQYHVVVAQRDAYKSALGTFLGRHFQLEERLLALERSIKESTRQGPIADLPNEMIYVIFGFLPLSDLLNCELVCSNWRQSLLEWLHVLDLSKYNNAVNNAVIQHVSKYHKLESLSLARCKDVTDVSMPIIIKSFPNLKELDLFGCQVTHLGLLGGLSQLISLRLGDSVPINDAHLKLIPTQLRRLNLEWLHALQGEGLANLEHMTNLVSLTIEQNDNLKQSGMVLPQSLIPTLRKFVVIRQGWFTDLPLEALANFENLEVLHLYWVPIGGSAFTNMAKMKNLRKLKLRRCHTMSNAGFDALTRSLSHLQVLEFKGVSQVDREGMKFLSRMTALKDLRLRCSRAVIDENGLTDLEFLTNMRLHSLELIDCVGLTGTGIKKIVDSQEYTLQKLLLGDCHLLHTADLIPLKRLKRLRIFNIDHAHHLKGSEENFSFWMLPNGGIDFSEVSVEEVSDPVDPVLDLENTNNLNALNDDGVEIVTHHPGAIPRAHRFHPRRRPVVVPQLPQTLPLLPPAPRPGTMEGIMQEVLQRINAPRFNVPQVPRIIAPQVPPSVARPLPRLREIGNTADDLIDYTDFILQRSLQRAAGLDAGQPRDRIVIDLDDEDEDAGVDEEPEERLPSVDRMELEDNDDNDINWADL